MERILIPLDGSTLSEAIVPLAAALARDHGAELLLFRAVRGRTATDPALFEPEVRIGEAEVYLHGIAETLQASGLSRVHRIVMYGDATPDQMITETARRHAVDLIAMGTHGRGGLGRLLLGSVAESVVRQAPAPVLLVRGQPAWGRGAITKILVPLDGSELSAAILHIVARVAGPLDLAMALLQVVEPLSPTAMGEVAGRWHEVMALRRADAEQYLSKIAGDLEARGLRVECAVRTGSAVEAIQAYAREQRIGLIAMSTHGRTGLGRLFFGSVAESVLRHATVPVLLWKAREEQS